MKNLAVVDGENLEEEMLHISPYNLGGNVGYKHNIKHEKKSIHDILICEHNIRKSDIVMNMHLIIILLFVQQIKYLYSYIYIT